MIAAPAAGQLAHRQRRPSRAARRQRAAAMASLLVESVTGRKMKLAGKDACRPRPSLRAHARSNSVTRSLRRDAHGDVGGFGRVGERADADEVHAGLGIGADVLEHECRPRPRWESSGSSTAARLRLLRCARPTASPRAASCCPAGWLRRRTRALLPAPAAVRTSTCTRWPFLRCSRARVRTAGNAAAERDVVVLDENAGGQIDAVIGAAAAQHGVLFQRAQAGHGLARVEHVGVRALEWRRRIGASAWRCRSGAASG